MPTHSEQHSARTNFMTEGSKALMIMNGGAAVAILGFLASTWSTVPKALIDASLKSLYLFAIGMVAAAGIFFFRYWTSYSFESGWRVRYRMFQALEWLSVVSAVSLFLLAIFMLIFGAQHALHSVGA